MGSFIVFVLMIEFSVTEPLTAYVFIFDCATLKNVIIHPACPSLMEWKCIDQ